jgi:hypothetical protein
LKLDCELKDAERLKDKQRIQDLKRTNNELGNKYASIKKGGKDLDLKLESAPEPLTDEELKMWRKQTLACFALARIAKYRDPKIGTDKEEKVVIKLPNKLNLQDFFENSISKSAPKESTFLFRELENKAKKVDVERNAHLRTQYYGYKLLLDWDVRFEAPIKRKNGRKILGGDQMEGIDEGGPTSQFVSQFCSQLGELYVMLPIKNDTSKNYVDLSGGNIDPSKFLTPKRGYKVRYQGREATIMRYYSETVIKNSPQSLGKLYSADLSFNDNDSVEEGVHRHKYQVIEIAIQLYVQQTSGFEPLKDDSFQNEYDVARKYEPQITVDDLAKTARKYYRAVGRFLLHVMIDGKNPIPSTTMPLFWRNGKMYVHCIE